MGKTRTKSAFSGPQITRWRSAGPQVRSPHFTNAQTAHVVITRECSIGIGSVGSSYCSPPFLKLNRICGSLKHVCFNAAAPVHCFAAWYKAGHHFHWLLAYRPDFPIRALAPAPAEYQDDKYVSVVCARQSRRRRLYHMSRSERIKLRLFTWLYSVSTIFSSICLVNNRRIFK